MFAGEQEVNIPPPLFPIFQSWRHHCVIPAFLVSFTGYIITICRYLFVLHHNVFRHFRWNGRPFSSYCCGNLNGNLVGFSHVPMLIPRFVQCVPGLFRLLLICSLVVPLVTDLSLACSACYLLVPLVPCFNNVATYMFFTQLVEVLLITSQKRSTC